MRFFIKLFTLSLIFFPLLVYGDTRPLAPRFDVDHERWQAPKLQLEDKKCTIWVTIKNTLEIRLNDGNVISINLDTGEVGWGELELSDASICFWQAVASFFPAIRHNIILDYIYRERPGVISRGK